MAKKAVSTAKGKLLQMQREVTGSNDPQSLFRAISLKLLNSAAGWPFRQESSRRITATVLGSPYGEPSLYINAVVALSLLARHSLTEDKYGNVQRDVASIIRTFTTATKKLETFKSKFPAHWTDVAGSKETPEVDAVLEALKQALGQLIEDFGPYARDLRLTLTDVRLAREAAGLEAHEQAVEGHEMRQIR